MFFIIKLRFCEKGTKFLRNHHLRFVLCSNGQIYRGDFAKFCGSSQNIWTLTGQMHLVFTYGVYRLELFTENIMFWNHLLEAETYKEMLHKISILNSQSENCTSPWALLCILYLMLIVCYMLIDACRKAPKEIAIPMRQSHLFVFVLECVSQSEVLHT
jgi:hypothetical protein